MHNATIPWLAVSAIRVVTRGHQLDTPYTNHSKVEWFAIKLDHLQQGVIGHNRPKL